jgi:putative transposase
MANVAREFGWRVAAYCLMDNHYHLVIDVDERGMGDGFCRLNTAHATRFNRRHGRVNHLFGRRYGSTPLADQPALLWACRYVVLNPVRAGIVERPEDYEWSSYRAMIGLAHPAIPLATEEILQAFSHDPLRAKELFAEFVTEDASLGGSLRHESVTAVSPRL